jgi:hypothetical protein
MSGQVRSGSESLRSGQGGMGEPFGAGKQRWGCRTWRLGPPLSWRSGGPCAWKYVSVCMYVCMYLQYVSMYVCMYYN